MERRAFTLVELLVVVAIIALLIGILVPAVLIGQRTVEQGAAEQFMNGIALGLSVYKNDFDRLPPSDASGASGTMFGMSSGSLSGWDGGALMTQAVAGAEAGDGVKGLGFRAGGATDGPKSGPYVEPGENDLARISGRYYLVDQWDQPIAYYRARGGQSSLWPSGRFVQADNAGIAGTNPSLDNHPETDETALRASGFVLYSPGRDGKNDSNEARGDDIVILEP